MRSQSNGSMTALLVFIPLVAVPMLAVFGIPQFEPAGASSPDDDFPAFDVDRNANLGVGDSASRAAGDLFPPFERGDSAAEGVSHASEEIGFRNEWDNPFSPPQTGPSEANNSSATDLNRRRIPAPDGWETETLAPPRDGSAGGRSSVRANFDDRQQPVMALADDSSRNPFEPQHADSERDSWPNDVRPNEFRPIASVPPTQKAAEPVRTPVGNNPFGTLADVQEPVSSQSAADLEREFRPNRFTKQANSRGGSRLDDVGSPDGFRSQNSSPQPLTWGSAVRRLNELGIRHFQLEPGERDDFQFRCYFTPSDNPRITHRFEAEATEPLKAVQKVLTQVENWLEQRSPGSFIKP